MTSPRNEVVDSTNRMPRTSSTKDPYLNYQNINPSDKRHQKEIKEKQ